MYVKIKSSEGERERPKAKGVFQQFPISYVASLPPGVPLLSDVRSAFPYPVPEF